MRIKVKKPYYEAVERDFIDFVVRELDGNDYGLGAIEATAQTTENISKAFGRLLGVLLSKGIITKEQMIFVLEDYADYDEIEIEGSLI